MKLTKTQLKQIIKEELKRILMERAGETAQDVANRFKNIKSVDHTAYAGAVQDIKNMAAGNREMEKYYPHIEEEGRDLQDFAREVLTLLGEQDEETYEQLPSMYGRKSTGGGGYGNPISAKQAVWATKRGSIK